MQKKKERAAPGAGPMRGLLVYGHTALEFLLVYEHTALLIVLVSEEVSEQCAHKPIKPLRGPAPWAVLFIKITLL